MLSKLAHSLLLLAALPAAFSLCYFPNGDLASGYVACTDDTEHSACCGRDSICIAGGLCQEQGATDAFVRGSCTDQQWRSSDCPAFCIKNNPFGGAGIGVCHINGQTQTLFCTVVEPDGGGSHCDDLDTFEWDVDPDHLTTIGVASNPSTTKSSTTSKRSSTTLSTTEETTSSTSEETTSSTSEETTSSTSEETTSTTSEGTTSSTSKVTTSSSKDPEDFITTSRPEPSTSVADDVSATLNTDVTTSGTSAAPAASAATASSGDSSRSSNSDQNQSVIGLGVGLGVGGFFLLAGLGFFCLRRRRGWSLGGSGRLGAPGGGPSTPSQGHPADMRSSSPAYSPGGKAMPDLLSQTTLSELGGQPYSPEMQIPHYSPELHGQSYAHELPNQRYQDPYELGGTEARSH